MTDIVLTPITSGYNLSKINTNFDTIEESINSDVLHVRGGNNTMHQDLDLNGNALLNVATDVENPDSLLTVGEGDFRYYNVTGDTLTGTMNVNDQTVTGLKAPVGPSEAVRKIDLDTETAARIAADVAEADARADADAALQAQITEGSGTTASQFSVISWHDQQVPNSVNIPDNKNAWSFGPVLTIASGQVVTIGAGSFWTIADGQVVV